MVTVTRASLGSLLQSGAFMILFSCFVAQVWDSMDKFLSGKTTTAVRSKAEEKGGMPLPSIILCPGFKPELSREINDKSPDAWPLISYYDSYPDHNGNELKMLPWWLMYR